MYLKSQAVFSLFSVLVLVVVSNTPPYALLISNESYAGIEFIFKSDSYFDHVRVQDNKLTTRYNASNVVQLGLHSKLKVIVNDTNKHQNLTPCNVTFILLFNNKILIKKDKHNECKNQLDNDTMINNEWVLNQRGNYTAVIYYGTNGILLTFNFIVVGNPSLQVHYQPSLSFCLSYYLLQYSVMEFEVENVNNILSLHINNTYRGNVTAKFNQKFNRIGETSIRISNESHDYWVLNITVVQLQKAITVSPNENNNFSTNKNLNVSSNQLNAASSKCLHFNPEHLHWTVRLPNETVLLFANTLQFQIKFNVIGERSNNALVKLIYYNEMLAEKYMQLYDSILGLRVEPQSYTTCRNGRIRVKFYIETGSSVDFYYKIKNGQDKVVSIIGSNIAKVRTYYNHTIQIKSRSIGYTFFAQNPLGRSEEKTFTFQSSIFEVNLENETYVETNKTIVLKPSVWRGVCSEFSYTWFVSGNHITTLDMKGSTRNDTNLKYTFSKEGRFAIGITVKQKNNNKIVSEAPSAYVHVRNRIVFSFQSRVILNENETKVIKPVFNPHSKTNKKVQYTWLVNNQSIDSVQWNSTDNISSISYKVQESMNLTLIIQNEISKMSSSVIVQIRVKRRINVSIEADNFEYCTHLDIPFEFRCIISDNIPQKEYDVFVHYGNYNDTKSIGVMDTFTAFYQVPAIHDVYCKVLGIDDAEKTHSQLRIAAGANFSAAISSKRIAVNASITGNVSSSNNQVNNNELYKWYLSSTVPDKWDLIGGGVTILYKFPTPGRYRVSVAIDLKGPAGCSQKWDVEVYLPLTVTANEVYVKTSSIVSFTLNINSPQNTRYGWKINGKWISKESISKELIYQFTNAGTKVIEGIAIINKVSSSAKYTLYVEDEITDVNVSAFADNMEILLNSTVKYVPYNTKNIDFVIKTNVNAIASVQCRQQNQSEPFKNITGKTNTNVTIFNFVSLNVRGEITCLVNAYNNISKKSQVSTFTVSEEGKLNLIFKRQKIPPSIGVENNVTLRILNNPLPANLTWKLNGLHNSLPLCDEEIDPEPIRVAHCVIPLNISIPIFNLTVIVVDGVNIPKEKVVYSVTSFNIFPTSVQNGSSVIRTQGVRGSSPSYQWYYKNSRSFTKGRKMDLMEPQPGIYPLRVVIYNILNTVERTFNITVFDPNAFSIVAIVDNGTRKYSSIDIYGGQEVNFTLENIVPSVKYNWNVSPSNVFTIPSAHETWRNILFKNHSKLRLNSTITVHPSINNMASFGSRSFDVHIYQKVQDLQKHFPLKELKPNKRYEFNNTWNGSYGKCKVYITALEVNITVNASVRNFNNSCTVSFKTLDFNIAITYKVESIVSNPASSDRYVHKIQAIPRNIDVNLFNLTEFTVNKNFVFKISENSSYVEYNWFIQNLSGITIKPLGKGASLNVSFPSEILPGVYILLVQAISPGIEVVKERFKIRILPINATDVLRISNYSSGATVKTDTTIELKVEEPLQGTIYDWYFDNKKIASNTDTYYFHVPRNISSGHYTITINATGPLYDKPKLFYKNFTFCNINEPKFAFGSKRKLIRSKWLYSEVLEFTESPCSVRYKWNFRCHNRNQTNCQANGIYRPRPLFDMDLILDKPTLEIPPRAFDIGKYLVTVELQVGSLKKPIRQLISIDLTVEGTPLVPVIAGGLVRVIGNLQSVNLDASGTIDPDISSRDKTNNIFYKWHVDVDTYRCYTNTRNSSIITDWKKENIVINIKSNCLTPGKTYKYTLHVRRSIDMNSTRTSQQIRVIKGEAPLVQIECATCQAYKTLKYVRSRKTKLYTNCFNCDNLPTEYTWTVKGSSDNKMLPPKVEKINSRQSVLIIKENELDGIQTYNVTVEAKIDHMSNKGSTTFFLRNNTSPENGTCELHPDTGKSLLTTFEMKCSGWQDSDNAQQPFIYWLVTENGGEKSVLNRGIMNEKKIKLPIGGLSNYTLPLEIWVQDSLGSYTVALKKNVTVSPPDEDPYDFIQNSVLPLLKESSVNKDLNQVTTSAMGVSALISTVGGKLTQNKSRNIVKQLFQSTSELQATSVETVEQILNTFKFMETKTNPTNIQTDSRDEMFNSLTKMVNLSKSFSLEGISLDESAHNAFLILLTSNIRYSRTEDGNQTEGVTLRRNRREISNNDERNYNLLQNVYDMVLNTSINGEAPAILRGPFATTSLQKRNKGSLDNSRYLQKCYFSYDLPNESLDDEILEVAECFSFNPLEAMRGQNATMTISIKKPSFKDVVFQNLSKNVLIGVPTDMESTEHLNLSRVVGPDDILWTTLNFSTPVDGWNFSSIHLVVDIDPQIPGDVKSYIHLSKDVMIDNGKSKRTVVKSFQKNSKELKRTVAITGLDYMRSIEQNQTYYFGFEHDFKFNMSINVTVYITTCRFWNETTNAWEGTGCFPSPLHTTRIITMCSCNHLTSFGSSINISPNELDFTVLKKLNIADNPVALVTCVVLIGIYVILVVIAFVKDRKQSNLVIPFIGSDEGFYQYEIRIKTGMYPWAGTSANVGIQIFGTSCTTKVRVLKSEDSFRRNSLDIFRISVDRSIGKIHKIRLWHDNTGDNPAWYIERVVVRSLVNGEKFFFFCNRWIGTDCEDGELEHDFHVADIQEMQTFSTIFYDVMGRGFNDYHLWLSIFERPKFSKFTRVQRLTCVFTFIFTWMAVNALWFDRAPGGKVDVYIGFQGFSIEQIIIGLITVLMVFPLNLLFLLLFRKSREKKIPVTPMKIWKEPRRVMMDTLDLDEVPLVQRSSSDSDNGFQIGDISLLQRKKKHMDIHYLIDQIEDGEDPLEIPSHESSCRPRIKKKSSSSSFVLMLPHSFDNAFKLDENNCIGRSNIGADSDGNIRADDIGSVGGTNNGFDKSFNVIHEPAMLFMSPQHQYRTSSMSLPKKDNLVKDTVKRTQSAGSFNRLSSNEENRWLENHLSTDELRSHMTDIVEQQLSSIVQSSNTQGGSGDSRMATFLSDYTNSREEHYEAKLTKQIKRNEQLASQLQIPDIVELDTCTRWSLPYWCTYIGFICCFLLSAFCIIVIIILGQQFGEEKALKWLEALAFGVLEDCFLTYPFLDKFSAYQVLFQVVFVAAVLAFFVKPLDLDQVDHYDFMTCKSGTAQPINGDNVSPPTGVALESAKREGQQRKNSRKYAKDVLFQLLLLWLVISICSVNYTNQYLAFERFKDTNSKLTFSTEHRMKDNFSYKTNPYEKYWSWVNTEFMAALEGDIDPDWKFVSRPYIQQVRVINGPCPAPEFASLANISQCKSKITSKLNYVDGWSTDQIQTNYSTTTMITKTPWSIDLMDKGAFSRYSSTGYFIWLYNENSKKRNATRASLSRLKEKYWVDKNTVLLKHTVGLLNPNTNQIAYYNLFIEVLDTGYMLNFSTVDYFKANFYLTRLDFFSLFCIVLLTIIVFITWWKITAIVFQKGLKAMKRFWFIHIIFTCIVSLLAIILHIVTLIKMQAFKNYIHNGIIAVGSDVEEIIWLNNSSRYVFATTAFLVIVRTVRLISWSYIYRLVSQIIEISTAPLISVCFVHVLVVITFSHFGFLLFQSSVKSYQTFADSFLTALLYRWSPSARITVKERQGFGMFWHILYIMYWLFILINLFRAVLNNGRRSVKFKSDENFWKNIFKHYISPKNKKKRKHVHFNLDKEKSANSSQHNEKKQDVSTTTTTTIFQSKVEDKPKFPLSELPPLPCSIYDLNSNLITALAGLDKMISDDVWEEEMFSRLEKVYR